jgi:hypothetical protein
MPMTNAVCLFLAACLGAVLLPPVAIASDPPGTRDGEIRPTGGGGFLAWDAEGQAWLLPEAFWESYASRSGGVTWGRRTDYPEYGQVKEHDTLIIELDGETCLMEFFHRRWRRANDVRRWDSAFNEYGACPKVFD